MRWSFLSPPPLARLLLRVAPLSASINDACASLLLMLPLLLMLVDRCVAVDLLAFVHARERKTLWLRVRKFSGIIPSLRKAIYTKDDAYV